MADQIAKNFNTLTPAEKQAMEFNQKLGSFKEQQAQMYKSIGQNEVIVMPSLNLPPLDLIPRVEIIDNVNLNLRRRMPKIERNKEINMAKLLQKDSCTFMQGVTQMNFEIMSARFPVEVSEAILSKYKEIHGPGTDRRLSDYQKMLI